jgi:hypothetical protein
MKGFYYMIENTITESQTNLAVTSINSKESKICKTCNQDLPIDNFAMKKRVTEFGTSSYRQGSCKKCVNKKKNEYRRNLPDEVKNARNEKKRLADQQRRMNMTDEEKELKNNKHKVYKEQMPDWKRNEQKILQEMRVRENKRKWLKRKETEGCFHCKGENLGKSIAMYGEAYESHHVHDDKKKDSKNLTVELSKMVSGGYTWEKISEELDKTITLCKFCHSGWHSKNIYINFSTWKNYNPNLPLKF